MKDPCYDDYGKPICEDLRLYPSCRIGCETYKAYEAERNASYEVRNEYWSYKKRKRHDVTTKMLRRGMKL